MIDNSDPNIKKIVEISPNEWYIETKDGKYFITKDESGFLLIRRVGYRTYITSLIAVFLGVLVLFNIVIPFFQIVLGGL